MIARRAEEIAPFIVMEVLEKAREMERRGIDVIHLEVGEPDFDIPAAVKAAICKALEDGLTHYTHSLGDMELREAISRALFGCIRCFCQAGAGSGDIRHLAGFDACLCGAAGEGPGGHLLRSGLCLLSQYHQLFGRRSRKSARLSRRTAFSTGLRRSRRRSAERTKAIIINSPSNPTGNLLSESAMRAIAECSPYIVSDEIYHGLVYEGQEHRILEFTDRAFVLNGFSKLYAMTG